LKKINKHPQEIKNIFEDETELITDSETNNKVNSTGRIKTNFEYEFLIGDTKIILTNKNLTIEFYEIKPPHSRQILSNQLDYLFESLKFLKTISINKLELSSWFCVLWTPVKSSKGLLMSSSFLTYYQFNLNNHIIPSNNKDYIEIPIIGILPIKFENKIFLSSIKRSLPNNLYMPNNFYNDRCNKNNSILRDSIVKILLNI
jgi:hypothetical protein